MVETAQTARGAHARARWFDKPPAWLLALVILSSYQLLSIVVLWPLVTHGIGSALPAGADPQSVSWNFAWLPFALGHGLNPFVTNYVSYPAGVNLLTNTSVLGLAFALAPLTLAAGSTASLNVAFLLAPTLSAGAMYLLARKMTSRRLLAWLGGLAYGFGPALMTALGAFHLHLAFAPIPPLIALVLIKLFGDDESNPILLGLALGALAIGQFFISTEVLATTIVVSLLAGLIALALYRADAARYWRRAAIGLGVGGLTSLVVLAVPLWYVVQGPQHVIGILNFPAQYRADLLGPVIPDNQLALAPTHLSSIASHFAYAPRENYSYLGVPMILTFFGGLVALRAKRTVVLAGLVAIVTFIVSLGGGLAVAGQPSVGTVPTDATGSWLPWRLLQSNSLLENVQPARVGIYTSILVILVFIAVLDAIWDRGKTHGLAGPLGAAVLAGLCLIPQIPALPLPQATQSVDMRPPADVVQLTHRHIPEGAAVLTFPYPARTNFSMLTWQAQMRLPFKMPSAWFRVPRSHADLRWARDHLYISGRPGVIAEIFVRLEAGRPPPITPALRAAVKQNIHAWRLTWLLASLSGPHADQQTLYLHDLFGAPTVTQSTASLWRLT